MATGRVHQKVNYIVIVITIIAITILFILGYSFEINELVFFSLGITFGFFFDPDLDLDGVTMAEARIAGILKHTLTWLNPNNKEYKDKIFGFFLYFVKLLLYPYALMFPHRSMWSHLPIVADVIRILYIFTLAIFFYYLGVVIYYNQPINDIWKQMWDVMNPLFFSMDNWQLKLSFVFGSSLMTFSHLMMDGFKIRW